MRIGIVGGGIGGLAAAIALHRAGCNVTVFEQSKQFLRVGADINLTPKRAVRTCAPLDGVSRVGPAVREYGGSRPIASSRTWSGGMARRRGWRWRTRRKAGAPQLTIHRADLLAALAGGINFSRADRVCSVWQAGAN